MNSYILDSVCGSCNNVNSQACILCRQHICDKSKKRRKRNKETEEKIDNGIMAIMQEETG